MNRLNKTLQGTFVKFTGKFSYITLALAGFFLYGFLSIPHKEEHPVVRHYISKLERFKADIHEFSRLVETRASREQLREHFVRTRKSYKHLAVITEYFNPYETKFLNGPALNRVEESVPDVIIPPHGLQFLEEIIFNDQNEIQYTALSEEITFMQSIVQRLFDEPDLVFKFKDEYVFDALNAAIIRLIALGISGFDSPIAQLSIPEATETLRGIESVLKLYEESLREINSRELDIAISLINHAVAHLQVPATFDEFDRLQFIKQFANPLYTSLRKMAKELNLPKIGGRRAVNDEAATIFEPNAFNISFFSPDEHYSPTPERIELGKRLFYDPILSIGNNRSCASCHDPSKAFTDGVRAPLAIDGKSRLTRNTPTLLNSVLQNRLFYDSRTDLLENQLKEVIHNEAEMKGSLKQSADHLRNHPEYAPLFKKAYSKEKEPVTPYTIANAISSYMRTLVALNSRFDRFMRDQGELSRDEQKGFNLFMGKAKCGTCHFVPLFNGMVPPEFQETESEVLGVPKWNKKELDDDLGKFLISESIIHKYAFKTPTLRNIELTAPYMHNGAFRNLSEVMDFYNKGGGAGMGFTLDNQTLPPDRLGLTKKEKKQIIAFLKTLTDTATSRQIQ